MRESPFENSNVPNGSPSEAPTLRPGDKYKSMIEEQKREMLARARAKKALHDQDRRLVDLANDYFQTGPTKEPSKKAPPHKEPTENSQQNDEQFFKEPFIQDRLEGEAARSARLQLRSNQRTREEQAAQREGRPIDRSLFLSNLDKRDALKKTLDAYDENYKQNGIRDFNVVGQDRLERVHIAREEGIKRSQARREAGTISSAERNLAAQKRAEEIRQAAYARQKATRDIRKDGTDRSLSLELLANNPIFSDAQESNSQSGILTREQDVRDFKESTSTNPDLFAEAKKTWDVVGQDRMERARVAHKEGIERSQTRREAGTASSSERTLAAQKRAEEIRQAAYARQKDQKATRDINQDGTDIRLGESYVDLPNGDWSEGISPTPKDAMRARRSPSLELLANNPIFNDAPESNPRPKALTREQVSRTLRRENFANDWLLDEDVKATIRPPSSPEGVHPPTAPEDPDDGLLYTEFDTRGGDLDLEAAERLYQLDLSRTSNKKATFESPEHLASVMRDAGRKNDLPGFVKKATESENAWLNNFENTWLNSARASTESAPVSIPPQERVATPPPLPSFSRPRNPSERSSDIAEMAGRIGEVLDQEPSNRRMNGAPEGMPSQNPFTRLRDRATLSPDLAGMTEDIERAFDRDTKDKERQPEKKIEISEGSEKVIVDSGLGREFSAKESLLVKIAEDTRLVNSTTPALRELQSQLNTIEDGDAAAGKPSFAELYGTTITALQNNTSTLSAWGMVKNVFHRTIGNREKSANAILEKYNAIKAEADTISEQIEAAKKRIAENKTEIAKMESAPTLSDRERAMMRRAGITHLTRGGYERKLTQEEIEAAEAGPRREQETRFFGGLRGKDLSSDTQEVLTGMPSLQVRTEAVLNSGIKDTETARSIAEEMNEAEWKRFIDAQEKATVKAAPYTGDPNTRSFGSFYRNADKWNRPTINQEVYSSSTTEEPRTKQKPEAAPTKIKDLTTSELPELDLAPEEVALTEKYLGPVVPRMIKAYFKNTPEVFRSAIQSAEAFTQLEDPKDGLGSMFWRLNGVDLEDAKKYIENAAIRESKVPNSLFAEAKRANKLNRLILNIQRLYEGVREYTQKKPGGPESKYLPPLNRMDIAA